MKKRKSEKQTQHTRITMAKANKRKNRDRESESNRAEKIATSKPSNLEKDQPRITEEISSSPSSSSAPSPPREDISSIDLVAKHTTEKDTAEPQRNEGDGSPEEGTEAEEESKEGSQPASPLSETLQKRYEEFNRYKEELKDQLDKCSQNLDELESKLKHADQLQGDFEKRSQEKLEEWKKLAKEERKSHSPHPLESLLSVDSFPSMRSRVISITLLALAVAGAFFAIALILPHSSSLPLRDVPPS